MKKASLYIAILLVHFFLAGVHGQRKDSTLFVLDNDFIVREIQFMDGSISSTGLFLHGSERNYIRYS